MNEIKIRGKKSGYCKGEGGRKKLINGSQKFRQIDGQLDCQIDILDRQINRSTKRGKERKNEGSWVTGDGGFKKVIIYK